MPCSPRGMSLDDMGIISLKFPLSTQFIMQTHHTNWFFRMYCSPHCPSRRCKEKVDLLWAIAVCCSVTQRVAVCYVVVFGRSVLQYGVLQCVAVCCSVLQCVAVCWAAQVDRRKPPPPGFFFYLAGSLTKNPEEEDPPRRIYNRCFEGGSLSPGSWLWILPNRKPPRGGDVPAIKVGAEKKV